MYRNHRIGVMDVPVKPVYGIGEQSGIRISRVFFTILFLIIRLFTKRMIQKYVIRDIHPLVLFYALGIILLTLNGGFILRFFLMWGMEGTVPLITTICIFFCTVVGFQSILFAMLFDMLANKSLNANDLKDQSMHCMLIDESYFYKGNGNQHRKPKGNGIHIRLPSFQD